MSTIAGPLTAAEPAPRHADGPPTPRRSAGGWLRVALACGVLAAAGAGRAWQGYQVQRYMETGKQSPFPLADLPKQLGPWSMAEDKVLDPAIQRGASAVDSVSRTYVDDRTGVAVGVLVLYGPALGMHLHAPTRCYPAVGYNLIEGPERRDIAYTRRDGTAAHATVDALTFARGEGATAERRQVFYTWGHDDHWSPILMGPKAYQRVPGMFKVHLDRHSAPGEALDAGSPCESLLESLLPEIDARVAASRGPAAPAARAQGTPPARAPAPAAATR
jgi:hypothetical protein